MQQNSAVRRHTVTISLPCDSRTMHGNENVHGKGPYNARQRAKHGKRCTLAHGKEQTHGKEQSQRTAKKQCTANSNTAHGKEKRHGKDVFAVRQPFAVRIFIFFISVLFFLLLMFISQLVLYFVDYILVVLNTMCIYPDFCNTTYSTLSSLPPTHTYISGFRSKARFGEIVIACVPTGWSHLSDSSTTPIYIYYADMIALDGVATPEARCTAKP
jgi:hypothetical protein